MKAIAKRITTKDFSRSKTMSKPYAAQQRSQNQLHVQQDPLVTLHAAGQHFWQQQQHLQHNGTFLLEVNFGLEHARIS